jgi:acyl-ACP thioesterase
VPVEFVEVPERGRRYRSSRRVQLGDVDGRGEVHLEVFGRFLQDIAADDVLDSGLSEVDRVWVVRRYDIVFTGFPSFRDTLDLVTFCSGTGPCWAERRTSIASGSAPVAEAVALWVSADRAGGRPLPLPDEFYVIYGEASAGRRVRSRLQHAGPSADATSRPWHLRARDLDLLDHVNNARALEAIEDEVALRRPGDRVSTVSVEFRGPLERETDVELRSAARPGAGGADELTMWLLTGGEVRMSAVVTTAPTSQRP